MEGLRYWFTWVPGVVNVLEINNGDIKLSNYMVAKALKLPLTDWGIGINCDDPRVAKIFLEGRHRTLYPDQPEIEFVPLTNWRIR